MKAGVSVFFQRQDYVSNPDEDLPSAQDGAVYDLNLRIADEAERLGYDSLWSVEHHFTGYTMMPDVTQFLAYMAGRTKTITLGTAAIILPWHNPVRVAESVSALDHYCKGRLILGIGRGLGRVEFEGLNIPMSEARQRFIEGAEIMLSGLDRGYVEYDGTHFKQEKRFIRPAPRAEFKSRTFAAAVSPESQEIMARLGVGILISPQKPWDLTAKEHRRYEEMFREFQGKEPPKPIVACQVFVDDDPVRARELGLRHIGDYYRATVRHYEFGATHLNNTKGYEYYAKLGQNVQKNSEELQAERYAALQIYGTPKECVERIAYIKETLGSDHLTAFFSFGSISDEEAMRSLHLWSDKVRPQVQAL